ncbi:hypothetical protein CANCADRAFT_27658 [Tortispora caseinolytica NRRL Y-17796]|uniref:ATP synthase subunit 5, mitochondrial n=1 Tax=Tortispora caseinolytica NRRL Y-17796 TaxID=767744 RepID=A0A1E4TAH7_9ASCO|nr:hypothetical protein CANCADRAFT_27658 [Tortispora caseinolytica NRRL Y-17796]
MARTMATAPGSTEPPVQLYGVDGTYASALFTAAAKTSSLDAVAKSLQALQNTIAKDAKLPGILSDPALSVKDKEAVVEILSKSVGADKTTSNLLKVLADNNRLGLISQVADKFSLLMRAFRGEVSATITSAQPLDSRTVSRLESAISKSSIVGEGKKLRVSNKVDPSILGGLVVEVGDRTVDLSISSKIAKLNKLVTESV